MGVQSEIDRIITAVGNAYSKVSEKGGTVPASQTVANLATAIDSIPAGGGGGAGFKVTFPATAASWDFVNYADLLLSDGTVKSFVSYSDVSGKTIENVSGIHCIGVSSYYVLKMTLSKGSLAQCTLRTSPSATYKITTSNNTTMAFYGGGTSTFWWPLADTVISAIEMYNTD